MGDHPETPANSSSSIILTQHSERSWRSTLLQSVLRPIKHHVFKPGKPHDGDSLQLKPHKSCEKTCIVTERQVDGIFVYDIVSRQPNEKAGVSEENGEGRRRIYYVAGGSWKDPPSPDHWKFVAKLASAVPNTLVSLISVPLAPRETAPTVYPRLLSFYEKVMAESKERDERVVWAGDSSGGNIVLGLVVEALRLSRNFRTTLEDPNDLGQASEKAEESDFVVIEGKPVAEREGAKALPAPSCLILICPSVDATRENPAIAQVEPYDPILIAPDSQKLAADWAGQWALGDERVSPVLDENLPQLLRERGVRVHGVTAGYDILAPDAVKLRDKLGEAGVEGKWLHWEKQVHCFPLAWAYGFPESRQALQWLSDVLSEE
ncbi:hypothetical protein V5O48_014539 [Marasmius crinis-equi]|uniref:Alpha/beta hydrolase fold-3 domain-containing protein n=1 Tax=Marasmius crinis-equi TaxID=585013 RepID=A0ABR3EXD0_9AGAR